ncbi:MAG: winged helix-turn-helix domain-containing protein [Bacteroidales bacterium]|nr:winged helix-turn-helix domain-containing protein [Bacteroidales bacterium]
MLETLITSKTRIKILLRFFINSKSKAYLRNLAQDFNESTNAVREELNKFEEAGLLNSMIDGNKKMYQANIEHPLFDDIHNILMKHIGFQHIVENVIHKLGDVKKVMVIGDFAKGIDNSIIDLLFVSGSLNREYLTKLISKTENMIKRKIRYLVMTEEEFRHYSNDQHPSELLLLWEEK